MRRSLFRVAVAVAAVAMIATACGDDDDDDDAGGGSPSVVPSPEFAADTTMADLAAKGEVRVGTKFDQPLFGQQGLDGNVSGFDVEIAKIIASKLGIEPGAVKFIESPSAQREELIERGDVDYVVATYTINDKRKERISFAGPYYEAGQQLMVKSDNNSITGPDSLRSTNARVCSVQGSTPSENIRQYIEPSQLTLFDVYSKCADALRTGQIDAVTTDNVILLGFVDQSGGQFKLVGDTFTTEPYGIGVRKGDVAFCEFINQTLQEAADSGEYAAAWEKTAGKVEPEAPTLPTLAPCS